MEDGRDDQPARGEVARHRLPGGERGADLLLAERADVPGHEPVAEVAVGVDRARRAACVAGVPGVVDGVGHRARGRVGRGGDVGEHGDRIGDAEGEGAPALALAAPAAGGDAAHAIARADRGDRVAPRCGQLGNDPAAEGLARPEMDRDVPAIVDQRAVKPPPFQHRRQKVIGHRAGHGGHRRDEACREGERSVVHAQRHGACGRGGGQGRAQQLQLGAEAGQHLVEGIPRLRVGSAHLRRLAPGPEDRIDRPVLQVQTAAGQAGCRRAHADRLASGQGWASSHTTARISPRSRREASGRTRSMCPPMAA